MNFSKIMVLLLAILIISVFQISGCTADTEIESDEAAPAQSEEIDQAEESGDSSNEVTGPQESTETPGIESNGGSPVADGSIGQSEYKYSLSDGPTGIDLFWGHDGSELFIGIETDSSGWVSIGFDPESAMKGANIIFLALDEGELLLRDDFGTSSFAHNADSSLGGSKDITVSAANKESDLTVYEFSIPLDSGDEFDKVLSPGNTYNIILAINNGSIDFDRAHSARSSGQIQLD